MKRIIAVIILVTSLTSFHLQADPLFLRAGDTYTYQFSSLPFVGVAIGPPSGAQGYLDLGGWAPLPTGAQYRVEMFEDAVSGPSICTFDRNSTGNSSVTCSVPGAWQDVQGAMRITMLGGEFSVTRIQLASLVPTDSSHLNNYSQTTLYEQVPEPQSVHVLAIGGALMLGWAAFASRRYARQKNS